MFKKYFGAGLLLAALAAGPVVIYSQGASTQEREILIRGLAPLSMLKQQEKVDIIAVFKENGERQAFTLLQNVSGFSAGRDGNNSRVKLILPSGEMQKLNTFEARHSDAVYILLLRNKADGKVFPLETSSFSKLFNRGTL